MFLLGYFVFQGRPLLAQLLHKLVVVGLGEFQRLQICCYYRVVGVQAFGGLQLDVVLLDRVCRNHKLVFVFDAVAQVYGSS